MNMDNLVCIRCGANIWKNCEHNQSVGLDSEDRKTQSGSETPEGFVCSDCFTDEEIEIQQQVIDELIGDEE